MNKRKTLYSLAVIIPLFTLMVIIAPLASVSAHGFGKGSVSVKKELSPEMKAHHEEVMASIKANDFAKFKELTADKPFASDIDAEAFAKLVKAEELRVSGDKEGARKLLKDVIKHDIGKHPKDKKVFKHKMKRGADKPWRADRNASTTSE